MKNFPHWPSIALVGLFIVSWQGGAGQQPAPAGAVPAAGAAEGVPLRPFQRELLQLAFDAASAFPREPHGKNRSRAQEQVVVACFELGQPELALSYGLQLADWRRGCAYADFAWAMAKGGNTARAREYVALAEGVLADERRNPDAQEWRCDLIRLKVARALAALGDDAGAAKAAAAIEAASTHAVDGSQAATSAERAARLTGAEAAAEFAELDARFAALTLGQQHAALAFVARLHEHHFGDAALRGACEQRVASTWTRLPPALRLDALATMVRTDLSHGEKAAASALLATMRELVDGHRWRAEDRLPQVARLVELAAAVGEVERARAEAAAACASWHEEREGIVDIYRAGALRPLALACFQLGDRVRGEELLALVIEEGMENPNSRPRCDDLVATCVALARHGIEPSPAAFARLQEIRRGLGHPW